MSKVLSLDPSNALAWVNKGHIFDNLAQYDKAVSCYEHALRINPADASVLPFIEKARSAQNNKTRHPPKKPVKCCPSCAGKSHPMGTRFNLAFEDLCGHFLMFDYRMGHHHFTPPVCIRVFANRHIE
jgi:tetratricopeptide (TPR) repeat protein